MRQAEVACPMGRLCYRMLEPIGGAPGRDATSVLLYHCATRQAVITLICRVPGGNLFCMERHSDMAQNDESGLISSTFEEMARRLRACELELAQQNAALAAEVAERKRVEDALHQSEHDVRTILDAVEIGILVIDAHRHTIVDANPVATRIAGVEREEMLGSLCHRFVCPALEGECPVSDLGQTVDHAERTVMCADGSQIPIIKTVVPVTLGGRACFLESFVDITERKRIDGLLRKTYDELELTIRQRTAELAQANRELAGEIAERQRAEEILREYATRLEQNNQGLQQFAYVASHDLQEPLRKIQAFGDRLRDRCAPALGEQGLDYLGRMQNAASRMQALINGLLTYSRVTTNARPYTPVDMNRIAQEVLADLETRIAEVEATIEIGDLPVIEADPLQMRQLLQNLISNALKFHQENVPPVVKISAERLESHQPQDDPEAAWYQIDVADNGIGFDEKYLDRIFQMFQRLHGRGTYEGAGIGLAVCKKITDRHGGNITATSTPGKGATFSVTLPVHQVTDGRIVE